MKLPFTIYDLRFTICKKSAAPSAFNHQSSIENHKFRRGFTMMEIAISLAVIGIALVAIIGILPFGLNAQRENREKTLINQDASVFMEIIRAGMSATNSSDADLTNYVFAITNYQTFYDPNSHPVVTNAFDVATLTNNYRIIGILSTPEFTDGNGRPIPALLTNLPGGCYSNHVIAYVHSMSGLAVEKPPQANSLLLQSSFGYRVLCENLPSAFSFPPEWNIGQQYTNSEHVYYADANSVITYWQAVGGKTNNVGNNPTDVPTDFWTRDGYTQTMADSTHELRLTFLWPLLPNNNLPPTPGRLTYRTSVTGQLAVDVNTMPGTNLYFFHPQIFTNAP